MIYGPMTTLCLDQYYSNFCVLPKGHDPVRAHQSDAISQDGKPTRVFWLYKERRSGEDRRKIHMGRRVTIGDRRKSA